MPLGFNLLSNLSLVTGPYGNSYLPHFQLMDLLRKSWVCVFIHIQTMQNGVSFFMCPSVSWCLLLSNWAFFCSGFSIMTSRVNNGCSCLWTQNMDRGFWMFMSVKRRLEIAGSYDWHSLVELCLVEKGIGPYSPSFLTSWETNMQVPWEALQFYI